MSRGHHRQVEGKIPEEECLDFELLRSLCSTRKLGGLSHLHLQEPLTERTPFPDPRPIVKQSKWNRDASKASKPKNRSSPCNAKFRIKWISSKREERTSDTPHNNRSSQCAGRVDFVCVGDVCQKWNESCLVSQPEYDSWKYWDNPGDAGLGGPGEPEEADC